MSRSFDSWNPGLLVGLAIVGLFIAMAMFPGLFSSQDPAGLRLEHRLSPPSAANWFGTDGVGVDVYSRVVHGARTTLATIVIVLGIAILVGVGLGSVSGFLGGWIDGLLMRVADVFLAFPPLILALATNAVLGRGLQQTMFA
nr:D,D-dipeptide ABC transporter permease [Acidobacteriota bacterium]